MSEKNSDILITSVLLIVISILTVNKLSPAYLNADVLMNSIMSLQKVTWFYWGQNRLLNVVSFFLYPLKNPVLNAYGYLILSAVIFYSMLIFLSFVVKGALNKKQYKIKLYEVFICCVFIIVLFFKEDTLFNMIIWHVEYSLSFLCLFVVYFLLFDSFRVVWASPSKIVLITKYLMASGILFIAFGVNYSLVIPAVALSLSLVLMEKKILKNHIFLFVVSIVLFAIWYQVVMQSSSYSQVILTNIINDILLSIKNIIEAIHIFNVFLVLLLLLVLCFFNGGLISYKGKMAFFLVLGFCIFWLLFFSLNQWIHMNKYHYRYFMPILFLLISMTVYFSVVQLMTVSNRLRTFFSLFALIAIIVFFISEPKSLLQYHIMKQASTTSEKIGYSGLRLYAGNYWYVWPAVFFDEIKGYDSFGVAFRGKANKRSVTKAIENEIKNKGEVKLTCLYETQAECKKQFLVFYNKPSKISSLRIDQNIIILSYFGVNDKYKVNKLR